MSAAPNELMLVEVGNCIELMTGGAFVLGDSLLIGWRPQDAPDRVAVVLEQAGGEVHPDLPDRVDLHAQVLTRSYDYHEARDDAYAIFRAIHGKCCDALPIESGANYKNEIIDAIAAPAYIGQDEKGRFEFSTNYVWLFKEAP